MKFKCPACKRVVDRDARSVKRFRLKSYCMVTGKHVTLQPVKTKKPYVTVKASEWNKMQKETRRALAEMGAAALRAVKNGWPRQEYPHEYPNPARAFRENYDEIDWR
jgi:hypothetical protein